MKKKAGYTAKITILCMALFVVVSATAFAAGTEGSAKEEAIPTAAPTKVEQPKKDVPANGAQNDNAKRESGVPFGEGWLCSLLISLGVSVPLFVLNRSSLSKEIKRVGKSAHNSGDGLASSDNKKLEDMVARLTNQLSDLQKENRQLGERLERFEKAGRVQPAASQVTAAPARPQPASASAAPKAAAADVLSADAERIRAFVSTYNSLQSNPPANGRPKNKAREDFVKQFDLRGFSCVNGEAVAMEKKSPEFVSTDANPEFYGLCLKDDTYVVVPSLWRSWRGIQVNLFGFGMIFNTSCQDGEAVYNSVQIDREAVFLVHGESWQLKRPGQARIS